MKNLEEIFVMGNKIVLHRYVETEKNKSLQCEVRLENKESSPQTYYY